MADAMWDNLSLIETAKPERFDSSTLGDLPAPAQRFLTRAIPAGTTLHARVKLTMTGEIKLGPRWFPFTARQLLVAGVGFVWSPVVGGSVLRFTGADLLGPDDARMEFRFRGRVPIVRASGPDTARSARGRLAAETVAWAPQACTPQAGASWESIDAERAAVTVDADGQRVRVEIAVDGSGNLAEVGLDRWNGSARPPGLQPFGGPCGPSFRTDAGIQIVGSGSVGWDWRTSKAPDGLFFRYTITSAQTG